MQFSANDCHTVAISNVTPGPTEIVAAPGAGYRIVVLSWLLSLDAAGELQWHSGATALSGLIEVAADTPIGLSSGVAALICEENDALLLTATTAANGYVCWARVRA